MFREACQIAVEHGKFKVAWIGMVDRVTMKVVPIASAGAEPTFLEHIRDRFSVSEHSPPGGGKTLRVVTEKHALVSQRDVGRHHGLPREAAPRAGHLVHGDPAARRRGRCGGVLALYAGEIGFFNARK
jgi:hypothetical protein